MKVDVLKQLVSELIGLMNENDLGELEVEEAGSRIRLKKSGSEPAVRTSYVSAPTAAPPSPGAAESGLIEIRSPIVGTFYRSPSPDADVFVEIDDEVNDETVVCIIEAMKVMNEIKAEVHGRIAAVLVENGEPVEFGQPLFRVNQE